MLDWKAAGKEYAAMMVETAADLASELAIRGLPVFRGATVPPAHTNSPWRLTDGVEVNTQPSCYGSPTCWRAVSACRLHLSPTTSTDCASVPPSWSGWAWDPPTCTTLHH
jgi:hypothetical protein